MSRSYFVMTHEQHLYGWRIKRGAIETFDLSWPCLTPQGELPSGFEMSSHMEVVKIFKNMGVLCI